MTREEFELILEVLNSTKETRELNKLKEKISIFIDRQKLDEDYKSNIEKLASRMQELADTEIDK